MQDEYFFIIGMTKNTDVFCDKYSSRIRDKYVVHTKDYKRDNGIYYLPVYMVPFL